jgi:hypothetical protein
MLILTLIAAAALRSGPVTAPQLQEGFPDVPKTHWAYEAVTDLKAKGILIGYPAEQRIELRAQAAPPRKEPAARARQTRRRTPRRPRRHAR